MDSTAVIDAARRVAHVANQHADESGDQRHLAGAIVDEMTASGLLGLLAPARIGGSEADLHVVVDAVEAVASGDGSAGWCLLKAISTNMLAAYLPPDSADEMWSDPNIVTGGSFNPTRGHAVEVAGGIRLSGRWDWGTGVTHSAWMLCGAVLSGPTPTPIACFVPRHEVEVHDTWRAYGMAGTGSHDFSVVECFVPAKRCFSGLLAEPVEQGRPYRLPLGAQIAVPHAGVALGLAEAAVGEFCQLAATKFPLMSIQPLADRPRVQFEVGRARARLEGARAYVHRAIDQAFAPIDEGRPAAPHELAGLSLAPVHATAECIAVVDTVLQLAGGSAVHLSNPLQRIARDIHVAGAHFLVDPERFTTWGQGMLGR